MRVTGGEITDARTAFLIVSSSPSSRTDALTQPKISITPIHLSPHGLSHSLPQAGRLLPNFAHSLTPLSQHLLPYVLQ